MSSPTRGSPHSPRKLARSMRKSIQRTWTKSGSNDDAFESESVPNCSADPSTGQQSPILRQHTSSFAQQRHASMSCSVSTDQQSPTRQRTSSFPPKRRASMSLTISTAVEKTREDNSRNLVFLLRQLETLKSEVMYTYFLFRCAIRTLSQTIFATNNFFYQVRLIEDGELQIAGRA
jgi:hypothetical protein